MSFLYRLVWDFHDEQFSSSDVWQLLDNLTLETQTEGAHAQVEMNLLLQKSAVDPALNRRENYKYLLSRKISERLSL